MGMYLRCVSFVSERSMTVFPVSSLFLLFPLTTYSMHCDYLDCTWMYRDSSLLVNWLKGLLGVYRFVFLFDSPMRLGILWLDSYDGAMLDMNRISRMPELFLHNASDHGLLAM